MGLRGEAILQFDWTVRQITEALRRNHLDQNTLIIITSDNGPVLDDGYMDRAEELVGDHKPGGPFRGAKYSSFEAGSVVPFIVNWPGKVPAGKVSKALVSQIDNLASLARLAGTQLPEGAACDSREQLDTWLGKSDASCPYALKLAANHTLVARAGKWKYIAPSNGGPMITWGPKIETGNLPQPQLFDMEKSAYESDNVAAKHPDLVRSFQRLIAESRRTRGPLDFQLPE